MSRLLLFTSGISLFENLRDSSKRLGGVDLAESFAHGEARAWQAVLRQADSLRDELRNFARPFAPLDLANEKERRRTSAEIASLYLLRNEQEQTQDTLVFLCSDTGKGAFCALVNAMLLAEAVRFAQPGPLPTLGIRSTGKGYEIAGFEPLELGEKLHPTLQRVRLPLAEILVVEKLNPSRPDEFREALANLITIVADRHYGRAQGQSTVLNYTAGFKAAIPILAQTVAIAQGIDLICLYEEAPEIIHQPLIPIELSEQCEKRLQNGPVPVKMTDLPERRDHSFYEETPGGGIRLSTLGIAARHLLSAREVWRGKQT